MNFKLLAVIAVLASFGALVCAQEFKVETTEVDGKLVDDINLPFVSDPAVLGEWVSVDFVKEPGQFKPGIKKYDDTLFLTGLTFNSGGRIPGLCFTWTKGAVLDDCDKTASLYTIKEMNGAKYMFFEWKSGDYTLKHQKPEYYVLKKK